MYRKTNRLQTDRQNNRNDVYCNLYLLRKREQGDLLLLCWQDGRGCDVEQAPGLNLHDGQ